ncbi:MAG: hypothetical protein ACXAC2_10985, partial [Candidatus Kariarchaeaceae archaeon]
MLFIPINSSIDNELIYGIDYRVGHNSLSKISQENSSLDITPPTVSDPVDIIILVNTTEHNITWYIADKNPRNYSIQHNYQTLEAERNRTWTENQSISFPLHDLMIGIHLFAIVVEDSWNNSAMDEVLVTVREAAYVPSFENPNDNSTNLAEIYTLFFILGVILLIIIAVIFRSTKYRKKRILYHSLPPEDPLELES